MEGKDEGKTDQTRKYKEIRQAGKEKQFKDSVFHQSLLMCMAK